MAQQQQRCTPKCNSDHWRHISPEAISFVQSLLEPDPEVRSTVAEALAHPWLRRAAQFAEELSLMPESVEELQRGGNAPVEACTKRGEPHTPPPHLHRQQYAGPAGRRPRDVSAAVDGSSASRRSTNHDNFIYRSSRTSVAPEFLGSGVEHAGVGAGIRVETSDRKKLHAASARTTKTTTTTTTMREKEAGLVARALSPSQVVPPASPSTQTAASLLAQISAMQTSLHGADDAAERPSRVAPQTAEEGEDSDEEGDPFKRIFKTVMFEQ
ncbi:protein kinase-like protein [Trypanosoma conorhini]|uniref:Protein kinase-like protein n=1 Tax=Trypanosoma conorhini TaxID=83891 RepID=A0A422Q4M6_9TRYP|nr:protein kinase-like protein [Trypanosoma conorhini]RNF24918.1 protein kinase-like protein [Trypanosoma conorhini]